MPLPGQPLICPICGQGKEFPLIRIHKSSFGRFQLFECRACKVQFWQPFKNPGSGWYEENNALIPIENLKPKIFKGYHRQFFSWHPALKGTKILDLGCGTGEFIAEAKVRGAEVWGVDFDRNAIRITQKYFALANVYAMPFAEFFKKTDLPKFDIITFFEIVEHLDAPLDFIVTVKRLLKPGGKIVVSTPSRERVLANVSIWDFPPHHLTRWNKEAITRLFEKAGFTLGQYGYTDQFKMIMAAIQEKTALGLVNKTAEASKKYDKKAFLAWFVYFGACLKEYLLGGVPAGILWVFGKLAKRNGGTMIVEFIAKS